jgi:hypothetical protein
MIHGLLLGVAPLAGRAVVTLKRVSHASGSKVVVSVFSICLWVGVGGLWDVRVVLLLYWESLEEERSEFMYVEIQRL